MSAEKPRLYRMIYRVVRRVTPKYSLQGTEKLPDEACVIVGNHCQAFGPIAAELYMPRERYTWCIGEMLKKEEVPAYAFQDFWSMKPKATHWFYRICSHAIARPVSYVLSNANTIPVYHDARVMTTFRQSVVKLKEGADLVIFPEKNEAYNGIVWKFQEHFADLATLYYKRTGTVLQFVPMYLTPKLGKICFGDAVVFDPEAPEEEERQRICTALMDGITELAAGLPAHRVVPYPNVPKKEYPFNRI